MPELTREEKLKLIEKLPPQLQEFLYSEDTGAALLYLGQKYNLPDEKVRLLSKLTGDVVLKIVPITSLAQEINTKIIPDVQAAMALAQELYAELLAPVLAAPVNVPPAPAPAAPKTTTPTPPYQGGEKGEVVPHLPKIDQYREPMAFQPAAPVTTRIIDLRKPAPVAPAPIYTPMPMEPETPTPQPPKAGPPLAGTPPPIKPAPATPLIEALPHELLTAKPKITTPAPPYQGGEKGEVVSPAPALPAMKPQYIMRPPGMPPTNSPNEILDLRRDKGEF